jgi:hypothetical protein
LQKVAAAITLGGVLAFLSRLAGPVVERASGRPFRPFTDPIDFLWRLLLGLIAVAAVAYGLWYGINSP